MVNTALPSALRRFLGADGVVQRVRPAAYAWCTEDERLLLVHVAVRGPGAGRWTLPGGGLRFGETPEAAAVREVREETGLEVALGELLGVRSTLLEPGETASGHRIQALGLLYRAAAVGGELRDEVGGSSDLARWFALHELASLPLTPQRHGPSTWCGRCPAERRAGDRGPAGLISGR